MARQTEQHYRLDAYLFWGTMGVKGMNQSDLARLTGLSTSHISKCLSGESPWTKQAAKAVAAAMGIAFSKLFKEEK